MTNDSIERETVIDAPVERVWELITEAEHLGRWFGDAGAEIDLRPGGTMTLSWIEHGTVRARVEEVEPNRRFSYRWAARADAPVDDNSTLVEFTLSSEGEGTRLRVVETGFATLDLSEEQRVEKTEDNTKGWETKFGDLEQYAQQVRA